MPRSANITLNVLLDVRSTSKSKPLQTPREAPLNPSFNTPGISHLPAATTANDYTKMMGDKNVFNMGYMQFPNYIQHMQQV